MQNKRRSSFKRQFGSFIATAVVLVGVVAAAYNAQLIRDTVYYYQYTPNDTIASFVSSTGMSDRGKFLFYVTHPSLENAEAFNEQCGKHEHSAAILGCYKNDRIYIYDITDSRLAGIRPTTAAHEMLHAAYARLSGKEKQDLTTLLESEYSKLGNNTELAERMKFYEVAQPGDRANELHSIIGTEVASISPELETYYGRYFSDRSKVIRQHEQYNSLFMQLKERAETLNARIDTLNGEIKAKVAVYDADSSKMQEEITDFNRRAGQGEFQSQADFARERQLLVARTAALDATRNEINGLITTYNALVAELNEIAIETSALNRSIDSNLAPAPSL